ncbi:MAG: hypothetical protein ACTSW4_02130 [Candidatus Ranarchaeia archaeon]
MGIHTSPRRSRRKQKWKNVVKEIDDEFIDFSLESDDWDVDWEDLDEEEEIYALDDEATDSPGKG